MNKTLAIIIPIVTIILLIAVAVGLYLLGDAESSALEKLRDIVIVFIGIVWVFVVLLLAVMVAVMVYVALLIKNRALPLLQDILANVKDTSGTVGDTAKRVKGSTDFVTEEVVSPIISFYGKFSKIRTTARMFIRPGKRSE